MSNGGKILDMGGRSAIQTAIAFIIAPTKKKRNGAAKKKKENRLNKLQTKRKASGTSDPYHYSLPFTPDKKYVKKIMDVCVHNESHCQCAKELLLESLSSNNSHVRLFDSSKLSIICFGTLKNFEINYQSICVQPCTFMCRKQVFSKWWIASASKICKIFEGTLY